MQLAVEARELLEADGIATRVVSMPCLEWFDEQDQAYRDSVLPPPVQARVSVEAGIAHGLAPLVGDAGRIVSLEHFGASADCKTLFREFGFTPRRSSPPPGSRSPPPAVTRLPATARSRPTSGPVTSSRQEASTID